MQEPGDRPFLSIVIPAYNETTNIQAGSLDKVARYMSDQSYPYEVVVVDDGSQDDTARRVEAFAQQHTHFRVIRAPHGGKAHALATGMLDAKGEIVLFCDMDQATPIGEASKLLPWFDKEYDIVIASRGTVRRNAPWWRTLMSRSQILLRNLILGSLQITDTQTGFKAFRRETIEPLLDHLRVYKPGIQFSGATVTSGFDVEMLFVARKLGYCIREVPVTWSYQESKRVHFVRDAVRGVSDLLHVRWADLRGAYPQKHITGTVDDM